MSRSLTRGRALLVCVLATFVGACGSDDSTSSGNDASSEATADVTASDVTIGQDAMTGEDAMTGNDSGTPEGASPVDSGPDGGGGTSDSMAPTGDAGDSGNATAPDSGDASTADSGSDASPDSGLDSGLDGSVRDGESDGASVGTVMCNGTTCDVATHVCCYGGDAGAAGSCVTSGTCSGGFSIACRNSTNCTGGDICCLNGGGGTVTAECKPTCGTGVERCTGTGDCPANEVCIGFLGGICVPVFDGGPRFDGSIPGLDGSLPDGG